MFEYPYPYLISVAETNVLFALDSTVDPKKFAVLLEKAAWRKCESHRSFNKNLLTWKYLKALPLASIVQ